MLTLQQVVERFDLPQILRHNAKFDPQREKLDWLNFEHLRRMDSDRFNELTVHALAKAGIVTDNFELSYVKAALATCKEKLKKFTDAPGYIGFYFQDPVQIDPAEEPKLLIPENKLRLERLKAAFAAVVSFDASSLEAALKGLAAELGLKAGPLVHPTRVALTGKGSGPSLYHLMEVLGRERVLKRLDAVLTRL